MRFCANCGRKLNKLHVLELCFLCSHSKDNFAPKTQNHDNKKGTPKTSTDILDYFPFGKKIRPIQTEILKDVENQIKNNQKFIILEAPTGSGKSWVAATLGLWLKGAIILTPQKNLEKQYVRDFGSFMYEVRGKQNFGCLELDETKTCSMGECFPGNATDDHCSFYCSKDDFIVPDGIQGTDHERVVLSQEGITKFGTEDNVCHYWKQKRKGEIASSVVFNYAMYIKSYLNEEETPDERTQKIVRDVLICDESHELEDVLVGDSSLELSEKFANKINSEVNLQKIKNITVKHNIADIVDILENLIKEYQMAISIQKEHSSCSRELTSKNHIVQHSELSCTKHKRTIKKCSSCQKKIRFINNLDCFRCKAHNVVKKGTNEICNEDHTKFNNFVKLDLEEKLNDLQSAYDEISEDPKNFVISSARVEKISEEFTISIMPISVRKKAKKLFEGFKHVVFLSSTIYNEIFMQDMGIDESFYKRYSSPFEIKNRQVIRRYVTKLNYKNKEKEMQKVVKEIEKIFQEHAGDKGIIHVTSYEYSNLIKNIMSKDHSSRLFFLHRDDDKEIELEKHRLSEGNKVIVSPGCWNGVDLKGDQSRFQIIVKAPYLPESLRVSTKRENIDYGKEWYTMRAIFKTIQGAGRSIRSNEDFSKTYLLDYKIEELLQYTKIIPDWFLDSISGPKNINSSI
jgi:Rad3-related DNA helicase